MARLSRFTQKIFGSSGSIGEFGSAAAGTPTTSTDLGTIQSLAAWAGGWLSAVLGASKFPAIEDMNAVSFVTTSQLAYLFQQGIPEYDSGTTYYTNGLVCEAGTYRIYGSKVNANLGNALSSTAQWLFLGDLASMQISKVQGVSGTNTTYTAAYSGYLTLRSNSGSVMVDTLPGTSPGVMPAGWSAEFANNDASGLLQIGVGAGSFLNGSVTNVITLATGQRCIVFSNGSSYYSIMMPDRIKLGANTTFYVATTGSDSANTGLTVGSPWATIAKAISFLQQSVDLGGYVATIQLADGTYTAGVDLQNVPFTGSGSVVVKGNAGTPANVVLSTTSANAVNVIGAGCIITVRDLKVQTTTGGNGINVGFQATCNFTNVVFHTCVAAHITATAGGLARALGNCSISGGAVSHVSATAGYVIENGVTVNVTTGVTMTQFCYTGIGGYADFQGSTFTGSAVTGNKYLSNQNGIINTNGAGGSFLPGTVAGSTATGGLYI